MTLPTPHVTHKGIAYYAKVQNALIVLQSVQRKHPHARVVSYGRGWAVQYRRSGSYYPEAEEE